MFGPARSGRGSVLIWRQERHDRGEAVFRIAGLRLCVFVGVVNRVERTNDRVRGALERTGYHDVSHDDKVRVCRGYGSGITIGRAADR
jgi:hypothetical protein